MIDNGLNRCGPAGRRHRRRSRPATTTSCSGSERSTRRCVPGTQRSSSMAPRRSSASMRRTVGSPSQKRNPAISCSASKWGMLTFSTAADPSARVAGATQAQLTSWLSKGAPTFSDQRASRSRMSIGRRVSQADDRGCCWQLADSRAGITKSMNAYRLSTADCPAPPPPYSSMD